MINDNGSGFGEIFHRWRAEGGEWSEVSNVSQSTNHSYGLSLVADELGRAHAVWYELEYEGERMLQLPGDHDPGVWYRAWTDGEWGESHHLFTPAVLAVYEYGSSDAAVDETGQVHVVWQEWNPQTNSWDIYYHGPTPVPEDQTWTPGDPCVASNPQNFEGGLVNTYSGNYTYQHTDISIPTLGQPLHFERSYNAHATGVYTETLVYNDALGIGWTHNYNMRLVFPDDPGGEENTVIFQAARGARMRFTDHGDGFYSAYPGIRAALAREGSALPYTYTVSLPNQTLYTFDGEGRLRTIQDPQGNVTSLTYADDRLSRVSDSTGQRYLDFGYDGQGRLTQISDPIGRMVQYGYDANGDLTVVTDTRGLAWTLTYTGTHLLYEITDPEGHIVERQDYDDEGRVIRQWDGLGNETSFTYGSVTEITDAKGNVKKDQYSARGAWIGQQDTQGETTAYTYDENYNRTSVTGKNGQTTRYEWNECGCNVTAITDALGHTTTMTYDGRNNLTSQTDALGHTTYYEYDEHNNLITVTNPLGGVTGYTYNDYGQVTSVTDENGHTTYYGYDSLGQRIAITDALGAVTTFGYDAVGRLITTTNPLGRVTVNEYDDGDHLVRVTVNYLAGQPQNYQNQYNLITEYA